MNTSDYKQFLKKKHSTMQTDQTIIDDMVFSATGSAIKHQKRIIGGESSEVYEITVSNNQRIFIKIAHNRIATLLREQWAITQCRAITIPTPKILHVKQLKNYKPPRTISIQDSALGKPLKEFELADDPHLPIMTRKAGAVLARINSISTKKFGKLAENGVGKYTTLHNMLMEPLQHKNDLYTAASTSKINHDEIVSLVRQYQEESIEIDCKQPRLLHSDYGSDHVFFQDGDVSSVIDFGDCMSGDPCLDIARWEYFSSPTYNIDDFLDGYESVSRIRNTYNAQKNFYMKYLNLMHLLYFYWDTNTIGLNHVKKKIDQLQ